MSIYPEHSEDYIFKPHLSSDACGFLAKPFKKENMRHYTEGSALHHHKLA